MIPENINIIVNNLAGSAQNGRTPPQLIAVTKGQADTAIDAALGAGQRIFGENRVQEAISHWARRRTVYDDIKLHLIGPLQTNKVRDAVALFDVIQTVDRISLIDALSAEMARQNRHLPCFIQVNIGSEAQKHGVLPENTRELLLYAREKGLKVVGLMCIPPVDTDSGPYFAKLREIAAENGLPELSMGMSADYMAAAAHGATYIRVGSGIFGARTQ